MVYTRNQTRATARSIADFEPVPECPLSEDPGSLVLGIEAASALVDHIANRQPLVLRGGLDLADTAAVVAEWEAHIDTHRGQTYQMGDGRGKHTLHTMWHSRGLRLEHGLSDGWEPSNPVRDWLQLSGGGSVAARFHRAQGQLEAFLPVSDEPAFAVGLPPRGRRTVAPALTHNDDYDNVVQLVCGWKRFFLASDGVIAYEDGPCSHARNERLDVDPLRPTDSPFPQPPLSAWRVAELRPSDVLFVPRNWWHFVQSGPRSIATNLWA